VNEIHARFADQGLVRPRDGRVLGGVIAGLGRRFGIDPWPARLLFVLILLVIPGSQILIYPLLWILMPSEQTVTQTPQTPPAPPVPPAPTTASATTPTDGPDPHGPGRPVHLVTEPAHALRPQHARSLTPGGAGLL